MSTATPAREDQRAAPALPVTPFALQVQPRRDHVVISPVGALTSTRAQQLLAESVELLDRGFDWLVLDLRATTSIGIGAISAIAAADRHARGLGARLTIRLGVESVTSVLERAGLLAHLEIEGGAGASYFDWTR